jgi:hypothetical protein
VTLLPDDQFGIRGFPGNAYDVPFSCSHPDCDQPAAHTHHCWPRSHLRNQPYEWVKLPDGTVIGNRLGFCVKHHDMLTGEIGGYRARLRWEAGIMWWEARVPTGGGLTLSFQRVGPTRHQPPVAGHEIVHDGTAEGEVCPTCGHHKKPKQSDRSKLRPGRETKMKEYTIQTPEGEAHVLDEHVEDLAIPLGMSDWNLRHKRYGVFSIALAWVQQNREQFIADIAEAAEKRLAKEGGSRG